MRARGIGEEAADLWGGGEEVASGGGFGTRWRGFGAAAVNFGSLAAGRGMDLAQGLRKKLHPSPYPLYIHGYPVQVT